LLFLPSNPERNIFSPRKQDGLKLYARKILIQEYTQDLLPKSLRFIQGVVDSEDLPLNVSRESVQSTKLMTQLKKLVTNRVLETLSKMAKEDPETYNRFWQAYSTFIKEGVATDEDYYEQFMPLLRYRSLNHPKDWMSLDQYLESKPSDQQKIYYILGEEDQSIVHSPHLEAFKKRNLDVLLFTDPVDPFVLMHTRQYKGIDLANAATEKLENSQTEDSAADLNQSEDQQKTTSLIESIKTVIGEKVSEVRITHQLVQSPARLVDADGAINPELQRVYRLMNKEIETPAKILEINPTHPIILKLADLPETSELSKLIITQIYENALLIEGLHPDPAGMIERIQQLMQTALDQ
jgi:molecular chaperone HtpG